jgi:hypothetical protein
LIFLLEAFFFLISVCSGDSREHQAKKTLSFCVSIDSIDISAKLILKYKIDKQITNIIINKQNVNFKKILHRLGYSNFNKI